MGKTLPQLYCIKMKSSYDLDFNALESPWQRNDAITFFYLSLCFSVPGVFFNIAIIEAIMAGTYSLIKGVGICHNCLNYSKV